MKCLAPCQSDPSQLILTYFGIWTPMGHDNTGAKFVRSRSRGFGGTRGAIFRLAWDMAYNSLPCTTLQAVKLLWCIFIYSYCNYITQAGKN
jgi:hypothetical protein